MVNRFYEQPILNSPYEYPAMHWELDAQGVRIEMVVCNRRGAEIKSGRDIAKRLRPGEPVGRRALGDLITKVRRD